MKIGDRNGIQDPRLTGAPAVEPRSVSEGNGSERGGDDHVDVSDLSRALARLFGLASAAPDQTAERSARVEALQQQLKDGAYQPDPQVTARRFLLHELA